MALNPENCLFCKIITGDVPAMKVWEDAHNLAFLDINPLARGHTLVIPRTHASTIDDLTQDEAGTLGRAVREVTTRVENGLNVRGTTIAVNNGRDAGQEVPHVHVHIVPRRAGDGAGPIHDLFKGNAPDVSKEELEKTQRMIRDGQ